MFHHFTSSAGGVLSHAYAGSMYKGSELQRTNSLKTEKDRELRYIVLNRKKQENIQKTCQTEGLLA